MRTESVSRNNYCSRGSEQIGQKEDSGPDVSSPPQETQEARKRSSRPSTRATTQPSTGAGCCEREQVGEKVHPGRPSGVWAAWKAAPVIKSGDTGKGAIRTVVLSLPG